MPRSYVKKEKIYYVIHYVGWKKRYDEWVDYDRILKINPENMANMAELKRLYSSTRKKKTKRTIKGLQPKRGRISKISKTGSVNSNQSSTSSVSSKLNETLNQKKQGRQLDSRSNNGITSNIKPIGTPDFETNKRIKPLINKKEQSCPEKENNLRITRSKLRKPDPVIIDFIDLTKDEIENNEEKYCVYNIYIGREVTQQPVIYIP